MRIKKHWAVFTNNQSNKGEFIYHLINNPGTAGFEELQGSEGALFSKMELERFLAEEDRHDENTITKDTSQSLVSMSSGEQKKALLTHILKAKPDFLVLDNPLDNLDTDSQQQLMTRLTTISKSTAIIQLISRKKDLLPFITHFASIEESTLTFHADVAALFQNFKADPIVLSHSIPPAISPIHLDHNVLISLRQVSVQYGTKRILKNINWEIKKGEFWQLAGKNGSGKTTLLSMITGENIKGYGQELYLFGKKKGSGESVWEIKKNIGFYAPTMTYKFSGNHSVEHMLISGLNDSIGLYLRPTEVQQKIAREWLRVIAMESFKNVLFSNLSTGQQRLVMTARAMIKHPPLLILDEPTAGLDDGSASLFVALVNKIASESETAIIFVSHRLEPGLKPHYIYQLYPDMEGSYGAVLEQKKEPQ